MQVCISAGVRFPWMMMIVQHCERLFACCWLSLVSSHCGGDSDGHDDRLHKAGARPGSHRAVWSLGLI